MENAFNELAGTDLECLPGVYELMDLLENKNVKKALVTNAPPSEMHFAVNVLKLKGRFDAQVLFFFEAQRALFTNKTWFNGRFDTQVLFLSFLLLKRVVGNAGTERRVQCRQARPRALHRRFFLIVPLYNSSAEKPRCAVTLYCT